MKANVELKKCVRLKTVLKWPWKLESSKECVTTQKPKTDALKMDRAQAFSLDCPKPFEI